MTVIFKEFITRDYIKENPNMFFVFGDNDERNGYGGQAKEMRGEPNSIGVRTKHRPSNSSTAYYTDDTYAENCRKIKEDLDTVVYKLEAGFITVFPTNGIGTGLSGLENRAPRTYKYLQDTLNNIYEKYEHDEEQEYGY